MGVNPQNSVKSESSFVLNSSDCLPYPIVAQGIVKEFQTGGETVRVLDGIDLELERGTLQFLMGPSGVGKTTLLSILAGILTPTAGQIHLLGHNIVHSAKAEIAQLRLKHTGFIFQDLNLLSALTTLENVELALKMKGFTGIQARQESQSWLDQVGLASKVDQLPRSLSGGEKQRVAIARGLAGRPQILFADEPTSALDSHNGFAVVEHLQKLAHQHQSTVLMATHDFRFTKFADRVLYLAEGKLHL